MTSMKVEIAVMPHQNPHPYQSDPHTEGNLQVLLDEIRLALVDDPPTGPKAEQDLHFAQLLHDAYEAAILQVNPPTQGEAWVAEPGSDPMQMIPSVDVGGVWSIEEPGVSLAIRPESAGSNAVMNYQGSQVINDLYVSIRHEESVPVSLTPRGTQTCAGYCVSGPGDTPVTGVFLFWAHSRTRIVGVRSPAPLVEGEGPVRLADGYAWRLQFAKEVVVKDPLCFEVEFLGEPPYLRDLTWLVPGDDESAPSIEVDPEQPYESAPPTTYPLSLSDDLLAFAGSTDLELSWVHRKLQDDTDKWFFHDLDVYTMPGSGDARLSNQDIAWLGNLLQYRYRQRAAAYVAGTEPNYHPQLTTLNFGLQIHKAALLLEHLIRGRWPGVETAWSVAKGIGPIRDAFLRFANGDLAIALSRGEPNGVNFFCFAELAFAVLEVVDRPLYEPPLFFKAPDVALWKNMIPVLCAASDVFVNTYHRPGSPRAFCAYRADFGEGKRASSYESADLKGVWNMWGKEIEPAQQFGRLVATALADEMSASVPTPYPLRGQS